MIVIADTSVLSALAEIGYAEILPKLFGKITITETVYQECMHPRAPATSRQLIQQAQWLDRVSDPLRLLPATATLDPGEASAISYAWSSVNPNLLLLDDGAARNVCQSLHLSMTGTLGLIFAAAQRGLVDFETAMTGLRKTSFRISETVIQGLRQQLTPPDDLKH